MMILLYSMCSKGDHSVVQVFQKRTSDFRDLKGTLGQNGGAGKRKHRQ